MFPHGNCRLRYERGSDVLKIYISATMVFVLSWRTRISGTKHASATTGGQCGGAWASSRKGTVSSVPAWFRADSGTNLIKQGKIVTDRPCGSIAQWSECCERSWVRIPVGPCASSSPVTRISELTLFYRAKLMLVIARYFASAASRYPIQRRLFMNKSLSCLSLRIIQII